MLAVHSNLTGQTHGYVRTPGNGVKSLLFTRLLRLGTECYYKAGLRTDRN